MKFTDYLDNYLDAKAEYDRVRSSFSGYDFDYFHHREVQRMDEASGALNAEFDRLSGDSQNAVALDTDAPLLCVGWQHREQGAGGGEWTFSTDSFAVEGLRKTGRFEVRSVWSQSKP